MKRFLVFLLILIVLLILPFGLKVEGTERYRDYGLTL